MRGETLPAKTRRDATCFKNRTIPNTSKCTPHSDTRSLRGTIDDNDSTTTTQRYNYHGGGNIAMYIRSLNGQERRLGILLRPLSLSFSLPLPPSFPPPVAPLWRPLFVRGSQLTMSRGTARSRRLHYSQIDRSRSGRSPILASVCASRREAIVSKTTMKNEISRENDEEIVTNRAVTKLRVPVDSAARGTRELMAQPQPPTLDARRRGQAKRERAQQ
ncbi:uncharacterized protein LOC105430145 isoform X2 [Pogonomyrmex barbatus]|nr:uncharacterized protein LOC105430145 isoform X2 [Pogonomyrmex barbatus]